MAEAKGTDVFDYLDIRRYLSDIFKERKASRRTYSYEAFSEELGFGRNSYSHQVISGTRPLTEKAGQRIAQALEAEPVERRYLLALVRHAAAKSAAARETAFADILAIRSETLKSDLDRSQLEYFSEWYHPVVRELVTFADFSDDPRWIARQLKPRIKPEQAERSLALLQRIGYIKKDPATGRWLQTQSHLRMPREVRSLALLRYHQEMIERAKESLMRIPAAEREIGALTLTVTREEFFEIKARLQEIRSEFIAKYGRATSVDAVAQLNIQFFPIAERQDESA